MQRRILFLATAAMAIASAVTSAQSVGPYFDTNPVTPGVTKCNWKLDGIAKPSTVPVMVDGADRCRLDLNGTLAGAHEIQVAPEAAADPIWGTQPGDWMAVPFSFTRPAPPVALTSKGLSP